MSDIEKGVELAPCPFCGGEASKIPRFCMGYVGDGVKCRQCSAETPRNLTEKKAVDWWNTRHSDPDMVLVPREPSQKEISRLRSLIHAMGWNPALFSHSETGLIYEAIVSGTWRGKTLPKPPTAEGE